MTKDNNDIHSYYSPNGLYNSIIEGLNQLGKDLSALSLEDLHPVDEFHIRGTVATQELIALCEFTSDMHNLVGPHAGCQIRLAVPSPALI